MKQIGLILAITVSIVVFVMGVVSFLPSQFPAETLHEVRLGVTQALVLYDAFEIVEIKANSPFELVHRGEVYPPISGETVVRGGRLEAGIWGLTRGSGVRLTLSSPEPQEVTLKLDADFVLPMAALVLLAAFGGVVAIRAYANMDL